MTSDTTSGRGEGDGGRFEHELDYLRSIRESGDNGRVKAGLRAARLSRTKRYGAGVIKALALGSGYKKATLYEYAGIARFLVRVYGWSARRTFDDHPALTYSHIRIAASLEDIEDSIMVLEHVERRGTSPDRLAVLVARWKGKRIVLPLFDERGPIHEVLAMLARVSGKWNGAVRVQITRVA